MKLVSYSSICVFCYVLFIVYKSIYLSSTQTKVNDFKWVSTNVGTLAGTFNLAFMLQCCIIPILNNNINYKNNIKDLVYGFALTWGILNSIGVVGSVVIAYSTAKSGTKGSTILDFFKEDDYLALFV